MNNETTTMAVQQVQSVEQQSMLAVIDRAARDPSVDVNKMERLLALQEKIMERRAKTEYDQAMCAAQSEMRSIARDCQNPQTRSRYASGYAIDNEIRPIYTEHGFAMSFGSRAASAPDRVLVTLRVSHRAGHSEYVEIEMPADGKGARGNDVQTKTHAAGSALSYAKRYLTILVWNLSFGEADDDGNAAGQRVAPRRESTQPIKTPQNTQAEPKRATTADVLPPKVATETRRKAVLDFLKQTFSDSELLAFANARGFIGPEMDLESWDLNEIPVSNVRLSELAAEIGQWLEGSEAPPKDGEESELPEFMDTVIHIPRKGMKLADYAVNPDTIKSLYLAAKNGDSDAGKRLFGFVNNFQPTGYKGAPPSREDFDLRVALDLFGEWREKNEPTTDVPTP